MRLQLCSQESWVTAVTFVSVIEADGIVTYEPGGAAGALGDVMEALNQLRADWPNLAANKPAKA